MKSFLTLRNIILLCVGIAVAYYFYSNGIKFKKENTQLKTEIGDLKTRFINLRIQEGELAFAAQEIAKIDEMRDEIQREVDALRSTMEKEQEAFNALQRSLDKLFLERRELIRKNASGTKFEKMTTPEGRIYENIEITNVGPDRVSFRFGGGANAAGLGLHQISDEWIEYFMYTDDEVNAACAKAGVKPRRKK